MRRLRIDSGKRKILAAVVLSFVLHGSFFVALFSTARRCYAGAQSNVQISLYGLPIPDRHLPHLDATASRRVVPVSLHDDLSSATAPAGNSAKADPVPAAKDLAGGLDGPVSSADQGLPHSAVSGVKSNTQSDFLSWVDSAVKEHLVYPDPARRRNIQGKVTIRLTVTPDGSRCSALVVRSSGFPVLDRAGLDLVESLFPAPIAPGKEISETLIIEYLLHQE